MFHVEQSDSRCQTAVSIYSPTSNTHTHHISLYQKESRVLSFLFSSFSSLLRVRGGAVLKSVASCISASHQRRPWRRCCWATSLSFLIYIYEGRWRAARTDSADLAPRHSHHQKRPYRHVEEGDAPLSLSCCAITRSASASQKELLQTARRGDSHRLLQAWRDGNQTFLYYSTLSFPPKQIIHFRAGCKYQEKPRRDISYQQSSGLEDISGDWDPQLIIQRSVSQIPSCFVHPCGGKVAAALGHPNPQQQETSAPARA